MKLLIVYYSYTGKTRKIAECIARCLNADLAEMREIRGRSLWGVYVVGLIKALMGRTADIRPIEADTADYDSILVAGPVWAGRPVPMLYDFIREYDLAGKQVYGLLTCGDNGKKAPRLLRRELERAGARCRSVITIKTDSAFLHSLRRGEIVFSLAESGKLSLSLNKKEAKQPDDSTAGESAPEEDAS